MKKRFILSICVCMCATFVGLGRAQQPAPTSALEDSPYIEELKKSEPFGGVASSIAKLEQLNNDGEYRQALEVGLMLVARYFDHRVPMFLGCGRSLAGLEKWSDCVEAYSLTVQTARTGERIQGVTESYMQDAELNLAALYVRKRTVVPEGKLEPMNAAKEIASRALEEYPDGSFYLLADHRAMRHPEAVLLLGEIEVAAPTDKAQAEPVLEKLQALIEGQGGERINVRTKDSLPYSTLALDCWWKVKKVFGIDAAKIEPVLKSFEKAAKDEETRALASILLGKLYEEVKGDKDMAKSYYMKGLSYNIKTNEEPLVIYMQEAAVRIPKK